MIGYKMIPLSNITTQFTTTTIATTITTQPTVTTDWSCGDSVTFTYKGDLVTYGTVESQGRCWLDRNLGASRIAITYNDFEAQGDLFQWGRGDDGHQDPNSGRTTNVSNLDEPGHSDFIYNFEIYHSDYEDPIQVKNADWRSPQNNNLWQGKGGINNPCPLGWHVPTKTEWENEVASWIYQNKTGGFASPLKLPSVGFRGYFRSGLAQMMYYGAYWSQTVCDKKAYMLLSLSDRNEFQCFPRCWGFAIRCIKD